MVGVRGFEPPTPSSRTRCATSLRYTPTNWCWRAYTVMTDFSQVFFKKPAQQLFISCLFSPSSSARNHLFPISFFAFSAFVPSPASVLISCARIFSPKHEIFAGRVAIFAALKFFLPTSRNFCCKFGRIFLSWRFFFSPFCDEFGFPLIRSGKDHADGRHRRPALKISAGLP